MGINQHYPSYKPPPFPYHNRSPANSHASATNFTTHNIPQTFTTAIRCTKCGKSFDNMPELHQHILACANASDKRRYTPKKNPIPLRHFAKGQNGVLAATSPTNVLNTEKLSTEAKMKLKALTKRQKKLAQKAISLTSANSAEMFVCPHCKREFTMRRSRTKHMAVCPKKPAERKTKEENERNQHMDKTPRDEEDLDPGGF
uniref:C2H2-type domain-containing protein n=1 Tax=Knipowitschia caucasica TaxID=637954 RepID=A0AAV2LXL1_KNICA